MSSHVKNEACIEDLLRKQSGQRLLCSKRLGRVNRRGAEGRQEAGQ